MILFHISHTDLDGYGCQFLTNYYFDNKFFYNANYGLEVKLTISKVLEKILAFKDEEILLLITDLNLTYQESKDLNKEINKLKENNYDIKLQLLDHHVSGEKSFQTFDWYFLDVNRCATKIVYDYLCENYNDFNKNNEFLLDSLVDCINAVDIWLENQTDNFEFGKVLMTMVSGAREINNILFPNLSREYRFFLISKAIKFLKKEKRNILLDSSIHGFKKEFLNLNDEDDTLDNLGAKYLVKTLDDIKSNLTVTYKNHKGLLTYCLGSISIPANAFLKANEDYDFFIDISRRGNASFRANGDVDVSLMAKNVANGGGHKNASGAKFEDFKETIHYEEVKKYIQEKLNKIS